MRSITDAFNIKCMPSQFYRVIVFCKDLYKAIVMNQSTVLTNERCALFLHFVLTTANLFHVF